MQISTPRLDRGLSAALYRAARLHATDLWLAVRFLGRADRDATLAIASLLRLLDDIVTGREAQDAVTQRDAAQTESPQSQASDSAPGPVSACACGANSLEGRSAVAHNIIQYLFEEAASGSIGRAELDIFVIVRESRRLCREPFDQFIDGVAETAQTKRVATRAALKRLIDALAAPLAAIAIDLAANASDDANVPEAAKEVARFVVRTRQLLGLSQEWRSDDRCLVALEDLASVGLRDSEFGSWLAGEGPSSSPEVEARCRRFMDSQRMEALAPLAGAVRLIDSLPATRARALAAYVGFWGEALLDARFGGGSINQATASPTRAVRFRAWRHAISRRVSPRLLASLRAIDSHTADPGAAAIATVSHRHGRMAGERV